MKKIILSMIGISFLFLSCNRELIEFQEDDSFSFSTSSAQLAASCEPDIQALEESLPETVTVGTLDPECNTGYFQLNISEGYLAGEKITAWCSDIEGILDIDQTVTYDVYSSSQDVSSLNEIFANTDKFDEVNWLLNQSFIGKESGVSKGEGENYVYAFGHIQAAIWKLVDNKSCTGGGCFYLTCSDAYGTWSDADELMSDELVAAALEHNGFEPQCGDQIAIVLASSTDQSLIITIDVPEKEIPCGECDGEVTELTLQYNGTEEAYIEVETKDEGVNGSKIVFEGTVAPGGMFTINGNDENGTFGEEIKVYVDGDYVKIKTDCSESIGPGLIVEDIEVISGMSLNGGELCPIPCDECKGGVTSFTVEYTGSSPAQLKVEHKDAVLFNEEVTPGQLITLSGSKDDGKFEENNLIFTLNGAVQSAPGHDAGEIHMSCSKPFYVGLPIGNNLVVTAGTSKDNGPICPLETPGCEECKGGVTSFTFEYTGSGAKLKVEHKDAVLFYETVSNGQLITLSGSKDDGKFEENNLIFTLDGVVQSAPEHDAGEIHMSCSKPFYVGLPIGNDIVVTAGTSKDNGPICEDTPPVQPDCQECKGGVTSFTFEYTGSGANLKVEHKDAVLFDGPVSNGQLITLSGSKDDGKFEENNLIFTLNGVVQSAPEHDAGEIHMSCSKPFYVGLPIGNDIVVTAGTSKDNGPICEETPPSPECECDGGIVSVTFTYSGNVAYLSSDDDNASFKDNGNGTVTLATFDGDKLSNPDIFINGNNVGEIHASCSDNILGLSYGNLTVVEYVDKEGNVTSVDGCSKLPPGSGSDCECDGGIVSVTFTYSGNVADLSSDDDNASFTDNGNGTVTLATFDGDKLSNPDIFINETNVGEIHASCSDNILGLSYGNLTVVEYVDKEGGVISIATCPTDPVTPGSTECDCDGKIVKMSVVYAGPNGATVTLGDADDGSNTLQTFTNVQSGAILEGTIGDVGNWWYWSVDGNLQASIHTSCSDDILGNVDASKSIFGNMGNYPDPADDDGNTNDGTFLVTSHTDEKGNTCSLSF